MKRSPSGVFMSSCISSCDFGSTWSVGVDKAVSRGKIKTHDTPRVMKMENRRLHLGNGRF